MVAISSNNSNGNNVAIIEDDEGYEVATIQWGTATSSKDDDQTFLFTQPFEVNCAFVITNRNNKGAEHIMPVVDKTKNDFTINRDDSISGDESFSWVAIGDLNTSNDQFSIPFDDKWVMKGGTARSTSDNAESFTFDSLGLEPFPNSCDLVLTQRSEKGAKCVMPVTDEDKNFFTCNRDGTIDGEEDFYWLAIGK